MASLSRSPTYRDEFAGVAAGAAAGAASAAMLADKPPPASEMVADSKPSFFGFFSTTFTKLSEESVDDGPFVRAASP